MTVGPAIYNVSSLFSYYSSCARVLQVVAVMPVVWLAFVNDAAAEPCTHSWYSGIVDAAAGTIDEVGLSCSVANPPCLPPYYDYFQFIAARLALQSSTIGDDNDGIITTMLVVTDFTTHTTSTWVIDVTMLGATTFVERHQATDIVSRWPGELSLVRTHARRQFTLSWCYVEPPQQNTEPEEEPVPMCL